MAYNKTLWVDDSIPYINATNLNNIENGIATNSTDIADNTLAIADNSAKVGISPQQAADITANNAKISYTDAALVAQHTADISSNTSAIQNKEDDLGNPSTSGYVLSSTSGGVRTWVGASGTWGSITGTLSDQTDLQNALDLKLSNLSEDLTPELGGNLDTIGNDILFQDGSNNYCGAIGRTTDDKLGLIYSTDGTLDPLNGAVVLGNGLSEIHGTTTSVSSLSGASAQQVYCNSDGTLYSVTPPLPAWSISDTDTGDYPLEVLGTWVSMAGLAVTAPLDVLAGNLVSVVVNVHIHNLSATRFGTVNIGIGINGATPSEASTNYYIPGGFVGYIPVSLSTTNHGGITAGDTIEAWGQRSSESNGAFEPVLEGSVNYHELILSEGSQSGSGGGSTTYLGLTDTPSTYSGQSGKRVTVKADETGLEFLESSGTGTTSADFTFDSSVTGDPGIGRIAINNGDASLATIIRVSDTDATGDSVNFGIGSLGKGDWFAINDTNSSDHYTYVVDGDPSDQGIYWDVPVVINTVTGSFNNNESVVIEVVYIGAKLFTDLQDTPDDFTGSANKLVAVNGTADALVYIDNEVAWGDVIGTLSNQTDLQTVLNTKLEATDYATSTVGGSIKARVDGTVLYLTIDGSDA